MPNGIERYCVSIEDIRAATNNEWGIYRSRALVSALPSIDGPKTNGRSCKLFRGSDVLARCRHHTCWTPEFEANLLQSIKQKDFYNAA